MEELKQWKRMKNKRTIEDFTNNIHSPSIHEWKLKKNIDIFSIICELGMEYPIYHDGSIAEFTRDDNNIERVIRKNFIDGRVYYLSLSNRRPLKANMSTIIMHIYDKYDNKIVEMTLYMMDDPQIKQFYTNLVRIINLQEQSLISGNYKYEKKMYQLLKKIISANERTTDLIADNI